MAKFIYYNPNPLEKRTGDCVIRALTKLLDMDWDTVFIDLFTKSFAMKDMMDHNIVWNDYLESMGYIRKSIPDRCPLCYSIADFCDDHPSGKYVVATDSHGNHRHHQTTENVIIFLSCGGPRWQVGVLHTFKTDKEVV